MADNSFSRVFKRRTNSVPEIGPASVPTPALGSPWSAPLNIQTVVYSDFFQSELGETGRLAAMQVAPVFRARSILVGIVSPLPLRVYDAEDQEVDTPWLYRTSTALPVWHRMAWTIDDLLFYGASLWAVSRDGSGQITEAYRVPIERWSANADTGVILVDGKPVNADDVIYIPGPGDGLLAVAGPTIRGARALDRAWIGRAQNPVPLIELHQISDEQLEPDEIDSMLDSWAAGRTSPTGAVGFTDNRVELRVHGQASTDLYVEGRNANVLDLARFTTIPAALLDGSMSTASLTYSTSEGKRSEFLDFSLSYWTAPIEARLSQDDVTPPGTRVRFDRASLIAVPNPTTDTPVKD
ncbi:MAG: phage portal protein [Protaetiibacter sp.]